MKNNNKLIIVVPVYNEEEIIQIVKDNIFKKLNEFDFNILIINDGSTDRSLQKIKDIKKKYGKKINYIDQKNIGH
jgi:glycosyltransferase involved in cell wall biosynthesis